MGKICSLIIDGGNCTYVASQRFIEKLALKTSPHPRPYKLQWLSENGELVVDIRVLICFSIGKYADEILFDVIPMEPSNLLRGRRFQYDNTTSKQPFYIGYVTHSTSVMTRHRNRQC